MKLRVPQRGRSVVLPEEKAELKHFNLVKCLPKVTEQNQLSSAYKELFLAPKHEASSASPFLPRLVPQRCTRKGGTRPGTEERLNLERLPVEVLTVKLISCRKKIHSENRSE